MASVQGAHLDDEKSTLVAAKALQQQRQDGATAARLIESASAPGVGRNLNTYA